MFLKGVVLDPIRKCKPDTKFSILRIIYDKMVVAHNDKKMMFKTAVDILKKNIIRL